MRLLPPLRIPRTGDDSPTGGVYRYVWRMSGMHQVWVSLIAAAAAALSMVPLELQRRMINDAVGGNDLGLLLVLGAIYLGVIGVEALGKFVLHLYQGWLSESAVRYSREHLLELQRRRGGDEGRAVAVISSEIDKLGGFVGEGISEPVVNGGMLIAIIGYMLVVQPEVALFAFAFLAPQVAIAPWLQRRINRLNERRLGMLRDLSDRIVEGGEHERSSGSSRAQLDALYRNHIRIYVIKFLMKGITNLLTLFAPLTVLVVGGYYVMQGEATIGVVVAFISGFERMASPLGELITYYRTAAQAQVQHRMIASWMR